MMNPLLAELFIWPTDGGSLPMDQFVPVLFVLVGIVAAAAGVTWYRRLREKMQPVWIFNRLARELGLGRPECRQLWRIARHQNLTSPVTLLLSPATLEYHTEQMLPSLKSADGQTLRSFVNDLKRRLFGVVN